jgi:hypothetical protein
MVFAAVNAIKLFLWKLYKAVVFAVLDYDAQLQLTKTPRQRLIIWSAVTLISITGVIIIFLIIKTALSFSVTSPTLQFLK